MGALQHQPFPLPPPQGGPADVLFVAAEHSGDQHAARAVRELRALRPELRICALGGPALAASGAQLLLDLTAHSALGFAAVIKFPFFRRLIGEIVRWVGEHRPRAVCFVDSSGLNLRIAKALFERGLITKAGGRTKALYFISPQIWASRAGRRFAMAKHLDGLATIFPFEAKCYADTALPVTFVGHPFVAAEHRMAVRYDPSGPVLLLPGSRKGAVAKIFPALLDGYLWYRNDGGDRGAVVLYPSEKILQTLRAAHPPAEVELRALAPGDEPVGASAVLTSSGTMSLQCALAGIPGAIVYRTDPFTYHIGRWIVKVPYLGIANLLLGEAMYPEYIQDAATPARLAAQLQASLREPARVEQTRLHVEKLRELLAQPAAGSVGGWLASHLG
ncbi:MAG TPA: lipid-A-disaccharide synthase [Opitutaceae bacterium]|nr:lipid-A-disaccharide synthase [Opitutaceae bacterium]